MASKRHAIIVCALLAGTSGVLLAGGCATTPDAADPPRPIAPLSTASVTSRRPTLRWALAPGTDGARVELCRDRACATILETIDATGTSATPATELPVGVVFWRLFARSGATPGTEPSPTWQLHAGARSAPIDTSWGTTLDVNGDGFADLVAGAFQASSLTGRAHVYLGSASGLATTPATSLTGPDGPDGRFGFAVASAGDVNGDGYADLVVGAAGVAMETGRAHVYLGGPSGLETIPATSLTGPDGEITAFGYAVASAGDVNGDGYADVAIAAPNAALDHGRVHVYLGSATGLATSAAVTLAGPPDRGSFGASVASAGDVNGDGYADLVVGADAGPIQDGRAYLYLGSERGLGTSAAATLGSASVQNDLFGWRVACAGDLDGDGYADVAISAVGASAGAGVVYVHLGSASGLRPTATELGGPDGAGSGFGESLASAGDVNGDGYADLAIGAGAVASSAGRVYLYPGGPSGVELAPEIALDGPDGPDGAFGAWLSSAGDVNGDGLDELAIGAPGAASGDGRVHVFAGAASGLGGPPATSLESPDDPGSGFGVSID